MTEIAPHHLAVNASKVRPVATKWLIPNVLAEGMPTCIMGEGGVGKTSLLGEWTARMSDGEPLFPGGKRPGPSRVLVVSVEDKMDSVLVPRLMAAGANLANVWLMPTVPDPDTGEQHQVRLPSDTGAILRAIDEYGIRLLVLDPVMHLLDDRFDANNPQQSRAAMREVLRGCLERHCSLLYINHQNKNRAGGASNRGSGSLAWRDMARAVMTVGLDPTDPAYSVIAMNKGNNGRAGAWRFQVEGVPFAELGIPDPDGDNTAGKVCWAGESSLTADDLNAGAVDPELRAELDEATDWLREFLLDGGPRQQRYSDDVQKEAAKAGIGKAALQRARGGLGVAVEKETGSMSGRWLWRLPDRLRRQP